MHTDEYEPEISPIIIGNAKLIIELMPYINDTTSTEPIAIIVVIDVHIVLVHVHITAPVVAAVVVGETHKEVFVVITAQSAVGGARAHQAEQEMCLVLFVL